MWKTQRLVGITADTPIYSVATGGSEAMHLLPKGKSSGKRMKSENCLIGGSRQLFLDRSLSAQQPYQVGQHHYVDHQQAHADPVQPPHDLIHLPG